MNSVTVRLDQRFLKELLISFTASSPYALRYGQAGLVQSA